MTTVCEPEEDDKDGWLVDSGHPVRPDESAAAAPSGGSRAESLQTVNGCIT